MTRGRGSCPTRSGATEVERVVGGGVGIEQKTINFSRADTKPVGFKSAATIARKN